MGAYPGTGIPGPVILLPHFGSHTQHIGIESTVGYVSSPVSINLAGVEYSRFHKNRNNLKITTLGWEPVSILSLPFHNGSLNQCDFYETYCRIVHNITIMIHRDIVSLAFSITFTLLRKFYSLTSRMDMNYL